jgi:hypothetical protein
MIRPCLAPPGGVLNGLSATPDWRGGNTRAGAHEHVDTKIDGELRLQVAHEPCQHPSQGPLLPGVSSHGPCIALSMLPPTGGRSSQARCLSLRPALGSPPRSPPPLLLHGFFFLFLGGPSPPSSPLSRRLLSAEGCRVRRRVSESPAVQRLSALSSERPLHGRVAWRLSVPVARDAYWKKHTGRSGPAAEPDDSLSLLSYLKSDRRSKR